MSLQECGNLPISSCTGILIAKYKELKSKLGLRSMAPIMCVCIITVYSFAIIAMQQNCITCFFVTPDLLHVL